MRLAKVELRFRVLGASCHICIEDTNGQGEDLLSRAKFELQRLESKFSAQCSTSVIARINKHAGSENIVSLDKESRSLFEFANALWHESKHLCDPSSEILRSGYLGGRSVRDSRQFLSEQLPLVGWSKVEQSPSGVQLPDKSMSIDLIRYVRPYAVDSIRRDFLKNGLNSALISLGDDIATIGKQHDGANWLIGVKYPKGSGIAITRLKLNDLGYCVGGGFEQSIVIGGERYGTALSPIDGQPIPSLLSVGVMADTCLAARGAVSIAQVKTEQAALDWLETLGLPWVAIGRDLTCYGLLNSN